MDTNSFYFTKAVLIVTITLFITNVGHCQGRFSLTGKASPKLSINSNTSVNASTNHFAMDNEADGKSAFGWGLDYGLQLEYGFGQANSISVGLGTFQVNQKFRPSYTFFGSGFRPVQRNYTFLHIPLEYRRCLFTKKAIRIHGGLGLAFVADVFSIRSETDDNMYYSNGEVVKDGRMYYMVNHLNMETFNLLYSASIKGEYKLSKRLSVFSAVQFKQGFRPLLSSVVYFELTHADGSTSQSHSTSISNGQCIQLDLGLAYNF